MRHAPVDGAAFLAGRVASFTLLVGLVLNDAATMHHGTQGLPPPCGQTLCINVSSLLSSDQMCGSAARLRGGGILEFGAMGRCAPTFMCFSSSDSALRAAGGRPAIESRQASPARRKITTRTRLGRRAPFWLSWIYRPQVAKAVAVPENMVLIQGFDWELMSDRPKLYAMLEREMPILESSGIKCVWFPPPSSSADAQGYLPGKWYDIPHRRQLEQAIAAAHRHGIVPMVDVVLNHRTAAQISPKSHDWTVFEDPNWGEWAIVKDDWKCEPEQHLKFCPDNCTCGEKDTGENACYAPDIDHTNQLVQADVVRWLEWLRVDLGFDAFRFDNTKGYAANFTAAYVEAAAPLYSVGEYFDTNKDLLTAWIRDSRKTSSLFDFGMRYKLKDSIHQDDYEHMLDAFYGPMAWYDAEHSVTFLDNHDTAGELNDRFGSADEIAMGYAVIITHPSVPCIFWQDWKGPKQQVIADLVGIRARHSVTPRSEWKVLHAAKGLYAAFIGGRIAVKLGSLDWSPNRGLPTREWVGVASGAGWCIWERVPEDEAGLKQAPLASVLL